MNLLSYSKGGRDFMGFKSEAHGIKFSLENKESGQ